MYVDCITVRIATFDSGNSLLVLEFILPVLNSINLIFCDHKIDGYAMG
jgi:hypothetical protein